ncbi:MAG: FAD binding domain-containing protein [Burkholderiaceae bacterium]
MKAARFEYQRASSLTDALSKLHTGDVSTSTKVIAGSQSLGPMLNMRLTRPDNLVDVSQLPDLLNVRQETDGIRIGAGVTHAQIEDGRHDLLRGHPLQSVARDIAYRAVRNRGTIGGSLAHADPAADWVVVLSAFDAIVHIASHQSQRNLPISQFLVGAYTTALKADELITGITIPNPPQDIHWGYVKFCRKPGEFAHASAAVRFEASTATACIILGALDGPPTTLPQLAAALARGESQAMSRANLLQSVSAVVDANDAARCQWHAVAIERALQQAGICGIPLSKGSKGSKGSTGNSGNGGGNA